MAKKRKLSKKGKKIISRFVIFLILIVVIIVVVLNNGSKNNVSDNKKDSPKKENKPPKVEEKVKILDLDSNSRPYAVMINNISTVWGYQCGLDDAYLVYEIIVEGGYTRLMAIFKDKELDRIGTVRSSRHYFLDYALENDAVYVHFGWSPKAESDMKTLGVNNINFLSYNGYTRDKSLGLATEHTAFTSTAKIKEGIKHYGYRDTTDKKPLLDYSIKSVNLQNIEGNQVANNINITYSASRSTSFTYDSEKKVYKRFQNGKEHIDYVTKNQYTAKNIITYQVANSTISGDKKNRQDIQNVTSGTGWYISEGYAVPITWEKTSRSAQTVYKYKDGTKIKVNDGNTYIQIQPSGQNLTIE